MTELCTLLDEYLSLRRAVGFKVVQLGHDLPKFVAFCEEEGARTITTELALRWAGQGPNAPRRLGEVRVFARYVQAVDPATEIPPAGLLPQRSRRRVPTLVSEDQVADLMASLRTLDPPLRGATAETVVGLLWASGLRVGEAVALDRCDVCFDDGLLRVRRSKYNKDRLVPLSGSALAALGAYARRRDRLCPTPRTTRFFVTPGGDPLGYQRLRNDFCEVLERHPMRDTQPRLGDLRHAFAVRTLLGWYRAGLDVEALLPRLSTYLGHTTPASTYWYLHVAPELMAIAAERLEPIGPVLP